MSILGKTWKLKEKKADDIVEHLLLGRNIPKEMHERFLKPDYDNDLHSPHLLLGVKKAVSRIKRALDYNEKIVIYGDYDADGVCGAALLKQCLTKLGAQNLSVYIPHRSDEGYGLNSEAMDKFIDEEVNLIITVDCGSTNIKEIGHAQKNGVDVIVTDHHYVPDEKNPAYSFINPHQKGDKYPFKGLCGTGVAFKLACALFEKYSTIDAPEVAMVGWEKWLLDLVALATVTDVMPLVGENRTLLKYGLIVFGKTKRPGLCALTDVAGVDRAKINPFTIGFILGPRLNAAGRMKHANFAFQLLDTQDEKIARELAERLDAANYERRDLVKKIIKEVERENLQEAPLVFAGSEHWAIGVAGIVAGRLVEKYHKPVFIYQKMQDKIVGSVRTPDHFNTVEMLGSASNYLEKFGGHSAAGGFTAHIQNEEKLYNALRDYATLRIKGLDEEELNPALTIDAELIAQNITLGLHERLESLEPFGEGNPRPLFLVRDVVLSQPQNVGAEANHFKCAILKDNERFKAIGFRLVPYTQELKEGDSADIVFHLGRDDFNGISQVSLEIMDIKLKN